MNIDNTIIEILNAISVVITAIIGAFSVVHDYKDKKGYVTKWGHRAIIAIIITTTLALTTQLIKIADTNATEHAKLAREKEAEAKASEQMVVEMKRHSQILLDLDRTMQPLKDVEIGLWLQVDVGGEQFAAYKQRVNAAVDQLALSEALETIMGELKN
jgi:hypothetical protein